MRLRGLHLDVKARRGSMVAQLNVSATWPTPAHPTEPLQFASIPEVIPAQGDPMLSEGGLYPSWVKSGGTLLPYSATTHTPGFMQPLLGPPLLHRLTPFTPLLMLGFGLNLLLHAGEILTPPEEVVYH